MADILFSDKIQSPSDPDAKVQVKIVDGFNPDGVGKQALIDDGALHVVVDASTIAPGSATASRQDTGNNSLSSIDGKMIKSDTDNVSISNFPAQQPSLSTVSLISASTSNVVLLAANASRKQAAFYNNSNSILYLKLGSAASNISYTVQMLQYAYYELMIPAYTGVISGVWSGSAGEVLVTELT